MCIYAYMVYIYIYVYARNTYYTIISSSLQNRFFTYRISVTADAIVVTVNAIILAFCPTESIMHP